MKYAIFAIFVLLIACRDDIQPKGCPLMRSSDAQPIQFWPIDCDTFNEAEPDGIFPVCFCRKVQCSDPQHLQFIDDNLAAFTMQGLPSYVNHLGTGNQWTGGTTRSVTCGAFQASDYLRGNLTDWPILVTGTTVYLNYTVNSPGFQMVVYLLDASIDLAHPIGQSAPISLSGGASSGVVAIPVDPSYANQQPFYVAVQVNNTGGSSRTFQISVLSFNSINPNVNNLQAQILDVNDNILDTVDFSFTRLTFENSDHSGNTEKGLYDANFTFEELGICDQQVRIVILKGATEQLKSECLDLAESWPDTQLIEYSNRRNYAGIINDGAAGTPENITFYLRVPAVFFIERFPSTVQVETLSNNQDISLNSQIERQKLLDIDYVPFYLHLKIQLALTHQFVTIGNKSWVKKEEYEIADSKKTYSLRRAQCYLNEKAYIVRNVL